MRFRLISLSATTGWLDWEHGELWLANDGILRRRRGWLATASADGLDPLRMTGAVLPDVQQDFSEPELENVRRSGGLWVPAEQVLSARLRAGILTGRVSLGLADGRFVKLLWARSPVTFDSLQESLGTWVGGRLTLD